jgi:hypothetical protein
MFFELIKNNNNNNNMIRPPPITIRKEVGGENY